MLKNPLVCAALVLLALGVHPGAASASAFGFGLSVLSGYGESDGDSSFGDYDFDITSTQIGFTANFGYLKSPFNWRLNVSAAEFSQEIDGFGFKSDRSGLTINNSANFALSRSPGFRLWLGPAFTFGFLELDDSSGSDDGLVVFSIGPAVGIDFGGGGGAPVAALEFGLDLGLVEYAESAFEDETFVALRGRISIMWGN